MPWHKRSQLILFYFLWFTAFVCELLKCHQDWPRSISPLKILMLHKVLPHGERFVPHLK